MLPAFVKRTDRDHLATCFSSRTGTEDPNNVPAAVLLDGDAGATFNPWRIEVEIAADGSFL